MTGTSPNMFRHLLITVACVGLILAAGAGRTSASAAGDGDDGDRSGLIHIRKNCSAYTGLAGGFCTITESSVAAIPPGSIVHYTQAFGILNAAWLDSNVVLDAGGGNKAVGRCTVDFSITTPGVCLFFNGTGNLAGFTARVNVTTVAVPPADYFWDGSYRFVSEEPER